MSGDLPVLMEESVALTAGQGGGGGGGRGLHRLQRLRKPPVEHKVEPKAAEAGADLVQVGDYLQQGGEWDGGGVQTKNCWGEILTVQLYAYCIDVYCTA